MVSLSGTVAAGRSSTQIHKQQLNTTTSSQTSTMNTMTAFTALVVVVAVGISSAHGLECYQGVPGVQVSKVACAGSCVTFTSSSQTAVGCYPQKQSDGCIQVQQGKACFCNTDLCNTGNSVTSTLWSVLLQSAISKNSDVLSFKESN